MSRAGKHDEHYLRSIFSVPAVDSFGISGNGKLAFTSNMSECLQLYLLDNPGADARDVIQLTSDREAKTFPVFFRRW